MHGQSRSLYLLWIFMSSTITCGIFKSNLSFIFSTVINFPLFCTRLVKVQYILLVNNTSCVQHVAHASVECMSARCICVNITQSRYTYLLKIKACSSMPGYKYPLTKKKKHNILLVFRIANKLSKKYNHIKKNI